MKIHSLPQDIFLEMIDPQILERSPEKMLETLAYLSQKIAQVMKADVCSLYLYNSESDTLTLKATHGLNENLIDHLTFKVGVGLTGMTLKLLKPITVSNVNKSDLFLPVPELGEEAYKSFLSIPLVYSKKPIGVMVVQNRKPTTYRKKDIQLLLSLSIPAVSVIERAKFLGVLKNVSPQQRGLGNNRSTTVAYLKDHVIKGIAAANGIAMAHLKIVKQDSHNFKPLDLPKDPKAQKQIFMEALAWVKSDVAQMREKAALKFGPEEMGIFEAYSLLLESQSFQNQILEQIENQTDVLQAIQNITTKYTDRIASSEDEYIRERSYDIQDLSQKISDRILYGDQKINDLAFHATRDTIFLYDYWSILDFTLIDHKITKGLLSAKGGANSHVALLADAASLPAVFGLGHAAAQLKDGDFIIVDGTAGNIIVNPSQETLTLYGKTVAEMESHKKLFQKDKAKKINFKNKANENKTLLVGANIELLPHVALSLNAGADDVGLYRTEFCFLTVNHLPTEEEQFLHYTQVLKAMKNKDVTFRTLDIGGDKYIPYLDLPEEANPFLGWRSIRFSLQRRDLFRIQLRALMRSASYGNLRILFPMVTSMEEVQEIKQTLVTVKKELEDEGEEIPYDIPIGFMIEVPASVEIAGDLAQEADFLSIGTNDLIQYGLAVDRTNPLVAYLYDPYHPAIIKMIDRTIRAAHKHNVPVSICGETAAKPDLAALYIGLGVDALSMNPQSIPRIKHFFRQFGSVEDLENLAKKTLTLNSGTKIRSLLQSVFARNHWLDYLDGHHDVEK